MRRVQCAAVLCLAALLVGCGALPRNAVPAELVGDAVIPGKPDIRGWAGRADDVMERDLIASFGQEPHGAFPPGPDGVVRYAHLALSGGGANGAFGAGFLSGWTKTGRRPAFKIVTGVSTGALMAPFAFLGPAYDDALREFYTTTSSRNIFRRLSLLPQLFAGEAFTETGPLQELLATHVDERLLRDVTALHRQGRRLYVGTADLDAQRFVVWNMGLIAAEGTPESLALFRAVMLASASIPVAFPPVFFSVEAGGRRYDEMHVDGGVGTRVFYTGGVFDFARAHTAARGGPGHVDLFVVHNGQLAAVPGATRRSVWHIAMRTFEASSKAAVVGDLFRLRGALARESGRFHWITMPSGIELGGGEVFDPVQMRVLYDAGQRVALEGPRWRTSPPGIAEADSP